MTVPFVYQRAESVEDAVVRLAEPRTLPMGGGTDLLVTIDEGIYAPAAVVDLRAVPASDSVELREDGTLRMGASARIEHLANHPLIRERYGALAEACSVVATPALREMGTLGGNLCQRPRCWYFRRGVACHKNGGDSCPAREGENQYLAILDGGPCYIVHPSDPAVALTALEAEVEIRSAKGERVVAIEDFYLLPRERLDHETVLRPGEVVTAVLLPAAAAGGVQRYHKLMQREAWDFALVSIAGCRRPNGDVRMVLGGVAPRPWRVNSSVEEDVASGGLDEDTIATLAERALYDAEPLSKNGYKVQLAGALLREMMVLLSS
ncbi:MAG TPA: xanthine dehydrogenase family protein subunit M [Gemmatimonadaceae bacterium]|jgi:xanthine dehydrogenase YagS FAD-binding subunit|nr:xanthine dehydrogenase family protein subunit M [Gemmatimonadaceae bacterium]